jgi:hypothetical protein
MTSKRVREDLSSKNDTSDNDTDVACESKQIKKTYNSFFYCDSFNFKLK